MSNPAAAPPGVLDRHTRSVRAEAVVDLAAVTANTAFLLDTLRRRGSAARLMAVVKADGYGHGAVPVAMAAIRGGATALGVATPEEALELRSAGVDVPILAWLWLAWQDVAQALAAGIELGVSSLTHLDAVLNAGGRAPVAVGGAAVAPRIHLKFDTGLGRNGAGPADTGRLIDAAAAAQRSGRLTVVGLMSHLACADVPDDPSVVGQTAAFRGVIELADRAGLRGVVRHLANSPATLGHPDTAFDLVRCGIGVYGVSPVGPVAGLRPAMALRSTVALTKRVPAGFGVSYGLTYRPAVETTLALIPLGYADGIPRAASSSAEAFMAGRRRRIAGRVAMDQFVVDCGDDDVRPGDEVLLFGNGERGEPTANDWGEACGTIGYEIVTRIGPRVPRRYTDTDADHDLGTSR